MLDRLSGYSELSISFFNRLFRIREAAECKILTVDCKNEFALCDSVYINCIDGDLSVIIDGSDTESSDITSTHLKYKVKIITKEKVDFSKVNGTLLCKVVSSMKTKYGYQITVRPICYDNDSTELRIEDSEIYQDESYLKEVCNNVERKTLRCELEQKALRDFYVYSTRLSK